MPYNKIVIYGNQKVDYLITLDHTATAAEETTLLSTGIPTWNTLNGMEIFAPFTDNLVSSYITGLTSPLTGFVIYRQKVGENRSYKVAEVDKDTLSIIDHLVANRNEYIWTVVPSTDNEIGVSLVSDPIAADWYGWSLTSFTEVDTNVYVGDETWVFKQGLGSPPSSDNLNQNLDITFYKNASKYPKAHVGDQNYVTSGLSCLLANVSSTTGIYDEPSDKWDAWMEFVAQGKPVLLKDIKGHMYIVLIHDNSGKMTDDTDEIPTTISFSYTQIRDISDISIYSEVSE